MRALERGSIHNDQMFYSLMPFRFTPGGQKVKTEVGNIQRHRIINFDERPFKMGEDEQLDDYERNRTQAHYDVNQDEKKIDLNLDYFWAIAHGMVSDSGREGFKLFGVPFEKYTVNPPKYNIKAVYLSKIRISDPMAPNESPVQAVIYETTGGTKFAAGVRTWPEPSTGK